jgi:membrane-bound serine protease (ClpP class)
MQGLLSFIPLDPNLAYLGLIFGLLAVMTIVYTPGTIIGEAISAVLMIGTLLLLSQLPTNWLAVLLIVMGISGFIALPFISLRWANVADVGIVVQIMGSFFLFNNGLQVSPVIILAMALLEWSYHRFVLLPALRQHHAQPHQDDSILVGMRGRVVKTIDPVGTVHVNGELWTARSTETIGNNTEVVVTQKNGLELRVEKAKRDEMPA